MNFSNASLESISVHYVGNKSLGQDLFLSKESLQVDEVISKKLKDYFLSRFTNIQEQYRFAHPSSLKYNEIFNFVSEVFSIDTTLHAASLNIAKHLYENSIHPKIKQGELYVCLFTNCEFENKLVDAIGIFKTENKNGFFEVDQNGTDFSIAYKEGIDINKLDKGCLIFNLNQEEGFEVCIIDNQNRGEEALYWKEKFLGLTQKANNYHQTNQILDLTKGYVVDQLTGEISRTDQIDMLNRTMEYFKENETFNQSDYETNVLVDGKIIDSYRKYGDSYKENNDIELADNFDISQQAVKKQARSFKSILKLDRNFHIYIHGDRDLIEQGVELDGRKYYKIYFEQES